MEITRYDGTRFITEEEIDQEFTGCWVLISDEGESAYSGYLLAVADGTAELRSELEDIGLDEYEGRARLIYGCKTRGTNLHVELLG